MSEPITVKLADDISAKIFSVSGDNLPDRIRVQLVDGVGFPLAVRTTPQVKNDVPTWDVTERQSIKNTLAYATLLDLLTRRYVDSKDLREAWSFDGTATMGRAGNEKYMQFIIKPNGPKTPLEDHTKQLAGIVASCKDNFKTTHNTRCQETMVRLDEASASPASSSSTSPIDWKLFGDAARAATNIPGTAIGIKDSDTEVKSLLAVAFYNTSLGAKGKNPEQSQDIADEQARQFLLTSRILSNNPDEQTNRVAGVAKLTLDFANGAVKSK